MSVESRTYLHVRQPDFTLEVLLPFFEAVAGAFDGAALDPALALHLVGSDELILVAESPLGRNLVPAQQIAEL